MSVTELILTHLPPLLSKSSWSNSHRKLLNGGGTKFRKILVSIKSVSAILGPGMAAPILWTPGKMPSFCRKTCVRKILVLRGGGILGLGGGGGSADFIFMGAGIFLINGGCVFSL